MVGKRPSRAQALWAKVQALDAKLAAAKEKLSAAEAELEIVKGKMGEQATAIETYWAIQVQRRKEIVQTLQVEKEALEVELWNLVFKRRTDE